MNREEMRRHIAGLLKDHHIPHRRTPSGEPGARAGGREVHNILPVKDEVSYATALHEIGHLLGGDQESRFVVVYERGAWDWAEQNALDWTPAMENERRRLMAGYEAHGPDYTLRDRMKEALKEKYFKE
jgi:hypothetical protein